MTIWYVYLLRCTDNTLYCGITNDLDRRIAQHNAGTGAKYTRGRTPVILEAHTTVYSMGDALRLESKIKKQPRNRKIAYLVSHDATL